MNAARLDQNTQESNLTVVKRSMNNNPEFAKIYINTLFPGFSYSNANGEIITPRNCILQ